MKRSAIRKLSAPWRMCRTCHRAGRRAKHMGDDCQHPVMAVDECGQCGKRRPLIECHAYDFRRVTPLPKRNPKRRASEWTRAFGSKERAAFVAERGCLICGRGPAEVAHVRSRGAGGGYADTVNLCRDHHHEQHQLGIGTFEDRYRVNLSAAAAQLEALWQTINE